MKAGPAPEPASYAGMFHYGPVLVTLLTPHPLVVATGDRRGDAQAAAGREDAAGGGRIRTACRIASGPSGPARSSSAPACSRPRPPSTSAPRSRRPAGFRGGRAGRRVRLVHVGPERRRRRRRPMPGRAPGRSPATTWCWSTAIRTPTATGWTSRAPTASGEPDDRQPRHVRGGLRRPRRPPWPPSGRASRPPRWTGPRAK